MTTLERRELPDIQLIYGPIDWSNLPPQLSPLLLEMFSCQSLPMFERRILGRTFAVGESTRDNWRTRLDRLYTSELSLGSCLEELERRSFPRSRYKDKTAIRFDNGMRKAREQQEAVSQRNEGEFEASLISALMDLEFKYQVVQNVRLANRWEDERTKIEVRKIARSLHTILIFRNRLNKVDRLEDLLETVKADGLTPAQIQTITFWQGEIKEEQELLLPKVLPYYSDFQTLAILRREYQRYKRLCLAAAVIGGQEGFSHPNYFVHRYENNAAYEALSNLVKAERKFADAYSGFGPQLEELLEDLQNHLLEDFAGLEEGEDRGNYKVDVVTRSGDITQINVVATSAGKNLYPIRSLDRRFVVEVSFQNGLQFDHQDQLVLDMDGLPRITAERILYDIGSGRMEEVAILHFDRIYN